MLRYAKISAPALLSSAKRATFGYTQSSVNGRCLVGRSVQFGRSREYKCDGGSLFSAFFALGDDDEKKRCGHAATAFCQPSSIVKTQKRSMPVLGSPPTAAPPRQTSKAE